MHWSDGNTHAINKHLAEVEAAQVGENEGDLCNRDGCGGRLEFEEPENCSCHINPPCASCTNVQLYCPECLWSEAEDEA